jgi:hypothetical protein
MSVGGGLRVLRDGTRSGGSKLSSQMGKWVEMESFRGVIDCSDAHSSVYRPINLRIERHRDER